MGIFKVGKSLKVSWFHHRIAFHTKLNTQVWSVPLYTVHHVMALLHVIALHHAMALLHLMALHLTGSRIKELGGGSI